MKRIHITEKELLNQQDQKKTQWIGSQLGLPYWEKKFHVGVGE